MFEVEYPKSIGIVSPVFFKELHQIVVKLFTWAPLDMIPLVSEAQDIHLGKTFAKFGLVYEAGYVCRRFCNP